MSIATDVMTQIKTKCTGKSTAHHECMNCNVNSSDKTIRSECFCLGPDVVLGFGLMCESLFQLEVKGEKNSDSAFY